MIENFFLYWRVIALTAIPFLGFYLYQHFGNNKGINMNNYVHFPQPGVADKKNGHFAWIEKSALAGDPRRSWDTIMYEQAQQLGYPPVLLVDWRPLLPFVILFILNHSVAEQITKPSKKYAISIPKAPDILDLSPLVGKRSLVTLDGEEWKDLRKRILPGFQPQHLINLVGVILDKMQFFIDHLDNLARTGEEFGMDELSTNLAFDVIGIVTFNIDLNAQVAGKQSVILTTYRTLQQAYIKRDKSMHWLRRWFTENERKIRRLDKELDIVLKEAIRKEYVNLTQEKTSASRCVAALSLTGVKELTPDILQQTSDTCRGFLFAGHDTTSILMQWMFYELSKRPASQKALKEELDEVFGQDPRPSTVIAQMRAPKNRELMSRLKYTDAVIKETLRLHPPGTTARVAPQGSGTILTLPQGDQLLVDGLIMSPVARVIQRDPAIFGETRDDFMPERWLGPEAMNIPEGAWRPYERGPRRCTGSELANMETRIVLASVARWFEFVKTGVGELDTDEKGLPILDEKGYYKVKSELFTTDQVTCKPIDGTRMKVKIREEAKAFL